MAFRRAKVGKAGPASYDDELLAEAMVYANGALEEAPRLPAALELRGTVRFYNGWGGETSDATAEWAAAEGDLRAAVESDPTAARAWAELSRLLLQIGRTEEAGIAAERAIEADAFNEMNLDLLFNVAYTAVQRGEYVDALRLTALGRDQYPNEPTFPAIELLVLASPAAPEPDVDDAWRLVMLLEERLPDMASQWELLAAAALARTGLADSARAVISRASDPADATALNYEANARLLLGDREEALRLLAGYLEMQPQRRGQVATDPWWESLRGDTEFETLLTEE